MQNPIAIAPNYREKIREIMRYGGPRMLILYHRSKSLDICILNGKTKKRLALLASFLMDLSHFYVILDYAIALSNTALIKAFVCS